MRLNKILKWDYMRLNLTFEPPLSPLQGAIADAEDPLAGLRQDPSETIKDAAENPVIKAGRTNKHNISLVYSFFSSNQSFQYSILFTVVD